MTKIKPGQLFRFGSSLDSYYIRLLLKEDSKSYINLVICFYAIGKFREYSIDVVKVLKRSLTEDLTKIEPEVEKKFWESINKEFLILSLFSKKLVDRAVQAFGL